MTALTWTVGSWVVGAHLSDGYHRFTFDEQATVANRVYSIKRQGDKWIVIRKLDYVHDQDHWRAYDSEDAAKRQAEQWEQEHHLTAHHEAGHAVAADRCRREVFEILIDFPGGFTRHQEAGGDYAFILYAGPWAQARAQWTKETIDTGTRDDDGHSFEEHVKAMFGSNPDDWCKYEHEKGGDCSTIAAYQAEETEAYEKGELYRFAPAPITTPDREWDTLLENAWTTIKDVATRMLAAEPEITLGDGEPLERAEPEGAPSERTEPVSWRRRDWTPTDDAGVTTR
jgi:hypothetical protein